MVTEESKVEALKATLVFILFAIIIVTAPTWGPLLDEFNVRQEICK